MTPVALVTLAIEPSCPASIEKLLLLRIVALSGTDPDVPVLVPGLIVTAVSPSPETAPVAPRVGVPVQVPVKLPTLLANVVPVVSPSRQCGCAPSVRPGRSTG